MSLSLNPDTFKMAFDNATIFTGQALPDPTDTPRQTPSRDSSRHRRRRHSSSQPAMPREDILQIGSRGDPKGSTTDDEMSQLDPRRFTPNLHASLVGQILTLQREVESRNNTVGHLEEFLHINKAEKEKLDEDMKEQMKENRSIRKQMELFETMTLAALGDITQERDNANINLAEVRQRLEASRSRIRTQEEESNRTQSLWAEERQNWEMEKRNMETKIHLIESRLKMVLGEIAAAHANGHEFPRTNVELDEGIQGTWYHRGSDSNSSRSNSVKHQSRLSGQSNATNEVSEYLNYRASTLSGLNGFGGNHSYGLSLAAELNSSGLDEDDEEEIVEDVISPDALPEEAHFRRRRPSVQSLSQDQKAWKLLGLLPEGIEQKIKEEGLTEKTAATLDETNTCTDNLPTLSERTMASQKKTAAHYMDSATQSSPAPSPKLSPPSDHFCSEKSIEKATGIEQLANQSRKRVSAPVTEQTSAPKSVTAPISPMVSASCQTLEQPLSPPLTPVIANEPPAVLPGSAENMFLMTSSSTQTEGLELAPNMPAASRHEPSSMTIPVIEIHPPGSRPQSSRNSVTLPPRTKNAGCQASIALPVSSCSVSVQTDAVIPGRKSVDPALKPRLQPASQISKPKRGLEKIDERLQQVPPKNTPKHPYRPPPVESVRPGIKSSFSAPVVDTYPGNNDTGPLSTNEPTSIRRPVRAGSLFAGFDGACAGETTKLKDFDLSSDDELATAAPIRKTLSKVQNSWKLVPQSDDAFMGRLETAKDSTENLEVDEASDAWLASLVPLEDQDPTKLKSIRSKVSTSPASLDATSQRNPRQVTAIAKASGPLIARRTSPSVPLKAKQYEPAVAVPPFLVPTRSSSRRIPVSASEGAQSPSACSTTFFSNTRNRGLGRPPSKNPLRKVRSAAAVPRFGRNEKAKTPPPPLSPSSLASDSLQIPRMPRIDITSRRPKETQILQTTHALPPDSLSGPASIDTPGQSTSVVDAIAQTMVGEWMWKYVRKRKSFGITDDVDFDENGNGNGIRHKRWVWLAPYERAVMWSSKQPTSGPALMGKNGRKLMIQSVLDVKDDAPVPKNSNSQTCFGRSILILTPKRALKFTATTQDRHYVWLTALSFLSHSPLGMEDLTMAPPIPQEELERSFSQQVGGGLRRTPIRDSIRIAKSKERPPMNGHAYSSPITTLHGERLECVERPTVAEEPDSDAAEPPAIPRTAAKSRVHARKRSSTGPRPMPPSSFHSFPAGAATAPPRSLKTPPTRDFSAFPPRARGFSTYERTWHHEPDCFATAS